MQLNNRVTLLELAGVLVALFGLAYGIRVVRDATKVLRVIRDEGDSEGLEEIARLLVVTASILVFVFVTYVVSGGLSMTIPTPEIVTPVAYVTQGLSLLARVALAYMLFYKHRVRYRVLKRDMADKELRAAAELAMADQLEQNTAALEALTVATAGATEAINGPLAAQIDATRAMDANTAVRVSDAAALLVAAATLAFEHDENTEALNLNTSATDRNTDHRDQNQRTRKTDEEPHE